MMNINALKIRQEGINHDEKTMIMTSMALGVAGVSALIILFGDRKGDKDLRDVKTYLAARPERMG